MTASLEGFENQTFTITQDPVSFNFTETAVSVRGTARRATVGLVSNGPGTWTLTASNGATLSDGTQSGTTITGTGSKDITISFPENTSSTAVDYTITGSMEGFDNRVFTLTQRGVVWTEVTRNLTINQTTVTSNGNDVPYSGDYDSEIGLVFNGVSDYAHNSATRLNQNCSFTLSTKEGTTKSISRIVIRFTEEDRSATTVTSNQNASSNTGTTTRTITYNTPVDAVTITLSRNNRDIRISSISVTYLYNAD